MHITVPRLYLSSNAKLFILSLLLSLIFTLPVIGIKNLFVLFPTLLLTIIFYTIFLTMTSNNYKNSLSSVVYPYHHPNMDDISLQNYAAGMTIQNV